jgi:hypothetical protein
MPPMHYRTASPYQCPNCEHGLSTMRHSPRDLFCRACRTAVVIIDHLTCVYMSPGESDLNAYCSLDHLLQPGMARQLA